METNRWVIQRQFARIGVEVEVVEDGPQALAAVAKGGFGLLVTDCHMPGMDGAELTRRIRAAEIASGDQRLPILGLTADVTVEMREQCLAAGMDDVASKPINLSRLGEVLRTIMRHSDHRNPDAASLVPASEDNLFDESTYLELFGDDCEMGDAWLESYIAATISAIDRVCCCIEADDRKTLRTTMHTVAGASRTAGAVRVGNLASGLEEAAPTAASNELQERAAKNRNVFEATREEMRRFLATHAAPSV
jgi:CheY-like chemotaxis protein